MKPERSLTDARASVILRELSCANQGPLVAAVCAASDGAAHRLAQALSAGGIEVALIAPDPAGVLEQLREDSFDAVVCAVSTRDGGLAEVRALRDRSPRAQIVLVTECSSRPRLRRMLDLGAQGVVLDSQVPRALAPAVRAACCGLVCVPTELSESVGCGALTSRQREVLRLAADGRANAEIAHELYLSESTVKAHLSAAFAKVGVSSRSEASALMRDPDIGRGLRTRWRQTPQTRYAE